MTPCALRSYQWARHLAVAGVTIGLVTAAGTSSGWAQPDRNKSPEQPPEQPVTRAATGPEAGPATGPVTGPENALNTESETGPQPRLKSDSKSPGPSDEGRKPWVENVPADQQDLALDFYEQGNTALDESLWTTAASHYRSALEHWDHPGIHYNLAIALINLDQPIPAYKSILKALRHGGAALESEQVQQAQMYRMVLRGQVAEIIVSCPVEGAVVTLNGKPLFTGPGRERRMVRPGAHQLIARKSGHVDAIETVVAIPDGLVPIEMRPRKPIELPRKRRWARWKPWAMVGAGAVVGLAGIAAHAAASDSYRRADELLARSCPTGCYGGDYPPAFDALEDEGFNLGAVAWTTYALGGGIIVAGAALVILNRPRPVTLESANQSANLAEKRAPADGGRISLIPHITPILTPNTRGLAAQIHF